MKNISNFELTSQYNQAQLERPHVSLTQDDYEIHYDPSPFNGHEHVDLGLPSGILWATMNVGATSEIDYGLYFQWGDTQGYTAEQVGSGEGQKYFGWEDYKYGNGTDSPGDTGMTKYNSVDGLSTLELSDDIARVNMGGLWHMPSYYNFSELRNNTTYEWTNNYENSGIAGYIFTSKINSNKIFFPASGYAFNGSMSQINVGTGYRINRTSSSDKTRCNEIYFNANTIMWNDYNYRCFGMPIRGVVG